MVSESTSKTVRLIDGAGISNQIKLEVAEDVARMRKEHGIQPLLVVVQIGDDPASTVYVNSKVRTCEELGMGSRQIALPSTTTTHELLALISDLNSKDEVDGILVQLPLPGHIEERPILEAIDPAKDVDGFHPINVGRLALSQPSLVPCTPMGVVELLERSNIPIRGANACVVGRSNIVGRPMAQLLLQRDATVTICHSRTRDLASVTRQADILIAAIGRAGFIGLEHIKPGAAVIDVGVNRVSDPAVARQLFGEDIERRLGIIAKRGFTITGDVNAAEADKVAGLRTPVPGGVGLLTVAMLMKNTLSAAKSRRDLAW